MAHGHGPTKREQQVLDLWESGKSTKAIAVELGVQVSTVKCVIDRLGGFGDAGVAFNAMVRQGSANLLAAIERFHPERCAMGAGR